MSTTAIGESATGDGYPRSPCSNRGSSVDSPSATVLSACTIHLAIFAITLPPEPDRRTSPASTVTGRTRTSGLDRLRRMAVTQQFARIPASQSSSCRDSAAELDELCSFRSVPSADYPDLDWWTGALKRTCVHRCLPAGWTSGVVWLYRASGSGH